MKFSYPTTAEEYIAIAVGLMPVRETLSHYTWLGTNDKGRVAVEFDRTRPRHTCWYVQSVSPLKLIKGGSSHGYI